MPDKIGIDRVIRLAREIRLLREEVDTKLEQLRSKEAEFERLLGLEPGSSRRETEFRGSGMRSRIRQMLAEKPTRSFSMKEITETIQLPPGGDKSLSSTLSKMVKLGQIVRVAHGRFRST